MKTNVDVSPKFVIPRKNSAISIDTAIEFNGKDYVDIRIMYQDKTTKELKPSTKGVMLTPCEFKKLYEYMFALNKDVDQRKRLLKLRKKEKSLEKS